MRNTSLEGREPMQYRIETEKSVWESSQKQCKMQKPLLVMLSFGFPNSPFVSSVAQPSIVSAFTSQNPKRPIMKHGDSQADYPRRRSPAGPACGE